MSRGRVVTAAVSAVVLGATAGTLAATAAPSDAGGPVAHVAEGRTGTSVNTCANPVLDRDLAGWGRHGTGATPSRVAVSGHVVANFAYSQPSANGLDPEMYLPQKVVLPGEEWTFAMDTWVSGPTTEVTVHMQVDWYSAAGAYLGHDKGPGVAVTGTDTERWTRVAGDFTAPAGAARANVTAQLMGPAGMTWRATACDYLPSGARPAPPTQPPPSDGDTAAGRFDWGTPLPASDEFNYGSESAPAVPDQSKWNLQGGPNGCDEGHDGNGLRCEANTRVVGGIARMTGEANGDTGWLGSKLSQRFGRWEVRARSQATGPNNNRQYHPVLIVWPTNNEWPEGAEYDYLENESPGEDCAEAFLHYPNHTPKRQEFVQRCGVDLSRWHNFALEWTPHHLKGYIDGVEWFNLSQDCIQCAPFPMNQTIQLDNFFGSDLQPAVFEIDWARVYAIPGVSR